MKVYEFNDHRALIRELFVEQRQSQPDLTYSKLAEASGLTPSFLSQAMSADLEFSNDQIYALGLFFKLDSEELEYLVLLNEYQRCQLPERKLELRLQWESIQDQHLRIVEYLSFDRVDRSRSPMDDFLCDPLAPILDQQFTVAKNLQNPAYLQKKLGIGEERFAKTVEILQRARIIEPAPQGFRRVVGETFVYKINASAKFNAAYSRLKAVEKVFKDDPSDLVTTLIFCANEEFIQGVKARLLAFQNRALEQHQEESPEDVYFINIDLFAFGEGFDGN